jgi:hydroxysqualene synthase
VISRPDDRRRPVEHYENFPVASWLCPPRLRRPVSALYWFARTADDIADEGNATEGNRLEELDAYQNDLSACLSGNRGSGRWEGVFAALGTARVEFALPEQPLFDLLAAFRQDVEKTRDRAGYRDREELLAYCSRSANPVGRLMLHLYELTSAEALAQSDAICTALQLANFWQDLSVDVPRGRYYLPATDAVRHGIDPSAPQTWAAHASMPAFVRELCEWTEALMRSGAPLVHAVPGRAGWELRLVVQGGLRILRRIEFLGYRTAQRRPTLGAVDVGPMLWHAMRM